MTLTLLPRGIDPGMRQMLHRAGVLQTNHWVELWGLAIRGREKYPEINIVRTKRGLTLGPEGPFSSRRKLEHNQYYTQLQNQQQQLQRRCILCTLSLNKSWGNGRTHLQCMQQKLSGRGK